MLASAAFIFSGVSSEWLGQTDWMDGNELIGCQQFLRIPRKKTQSFRRNRPFHLWGVHLGWWRADVAMDRPSHGQDAAVHAETWGHAPDATPGCGWTPLFILFHPFSRIDKFSTWFSRTLRSLLTTLRSLLIPGAILPTNLLRGITYRRRPKMMGFENQTLPHHIQEIWG